MERIPFNTERCPECKHLSVTTIQHVPDVVDGHTEHCKCVACGKTWTVRWALMPASVTINNKTVPVYAA